MYTNIPSYTCTPHLLYPFIYHGHLGCFHNLAIVNDAAVNTRVHVSLWISVFVFFGYIPSGVIVGSYDTSIFNFEETPYYFPQQCKSVPFSLYPCQHLLFLVLLILAILTGMRWYFIVVWICISLMTIDIEHLFMCLLATWMTSLEKCLFMPSAHF